MDDAVQLEERLGFGMAAVMARKGVDAATLGAALGLAPPDGPRWTGSSEFLLIGNGPGTWLAHGAAADAVWADTLAARLAGIASVSDQSSGYRVFRLSGPRARDLLQRGAFIDLDPSRFAYGSAATTVIAHIGVVIWQVEDAPVYDIALFRSFAGSFRHWYDAAKAAL